MPSGQPQLEIMVPYGRGPRTQSGTHAELRTSFGGKIINLGPTQPYKNPLTQEVSNQPYKYANPTQTPWDMNLNYIPGMHPFHWDLMGTVVGVAAPFIGAIDGALDTSEIEAFINEIHRRHPAPTNIPDVGGKTGDGKSESKGAYSNWFKRMLSVDGKGYRIRVGGPDGKLNLDENVYESGDVSFYKRLMNAKNAKWIKFEALGKDGKLNLSEDCFYSA